MRRYINPHYRKYFFKELLIQLIQITKDEAKYLRENVKNVKVQRTCLLKNNGKSRGKYYVEETRKVFKALDDFRKNITDWRD